MGIQSPHQIHRNKMLRKTLRKTRMVRHVLPRIKYYYIIAVVRGKRFIASVPGKPHSIDEARRNASMIVHRSEDLRNVRWDVIDSPYRDINHVMATIRHPIWANTGSIEEASQRMRHKP